MKTSEYADAGTGIGAPALNVARLLPASPNYVTLPIGQAFTWVDCLAGVEAGDWYLVVFRSVRRASADTALLLAYDDRAHEEARGATGLLHYFKGELNERRECLSFCLWQSKTAARAAAALPLHRAATLLVDEMYHSYRLERYEVRKHAGSRRITFQPAPPEHQRN